MKKVSRLGFLASILVLGLACGLGIWAADSAADGLQPPHGQIVPNRTASQQAKRNFRQALQEASPANPFEFRVTSEEITSLVALELQQQADIPLRNPQIWFADEKIFLAGVIDGVGPVPLETQVVAAPVVDAQGKVAIRIDEANMGRFKLSAGVVENLTETANESLENLPLDITIRSIEVLDDELIIRGTPKRF